MKISQVVLCDLEATFALAGQTQCEGSAMLIADRSGRVKRAVVPDQVANPAPACWVQVTTKGKLQLAAALGHDEIYVARIHSHPGAAFHSETDDANPALNHEGALSLVAPDFGAGLASGLERCAVYLRTGGAWLELPCGPERDRRVVVDG